MYSTYKTRYIYWINIEMNGRIDKKLGVRLLHYFFSQRKRKHSMFLISMGLCKLQNKKKKRKKQF
jgi:hypothetical protein